MRPAVFLDRDGTVIEWVHHLRDPGSVKLIPSAAPALRRLREAGYACVLVTNQSVIGRGYITVAQLDEIHAELTGQLVAAGAALDGIYFCPEKPQQNDPTVIEHPERKPGPGMLLRAARELRLDLACSWMVGDSISDTLAGRNAGCRGSILVHTGHGTNAARHAGHFDYQVPDIGAAARLILEHGSRGPQQGREEERHKEGTV